ncbi:MAG: glutamate 5-kinase [Nitrospiria bacterium]
MRNELIRKARRVVLKIGSSIITSKERGLNLARVDALAKEVCDLMGRGLQVVLVSSGAIASGLEPLGLSQRPRDLVLKQAAAAVGQSRLMWSYEKAFNPFGQKVAQILLTHEDLSQRKRFLNARNTLLTLLRHGVIPVINENDTVAVEEIQFGDNDMLAGLVTHLIDGQLLIILSDVDGLYTRDPKRDPKAERLPVVSEVTPEIERLAGGSSTAEGTGGMASKVRAAKQAAAYGVATIVVNGQKESVLTRLFKGEDVGTLFLPRPSRLKSRKHWIAYTRRSKGRLVLDAGAVGALLQKGKSLLPSGVVKVDGEFEGGDAVSCLDEKGMEIARGLVNYSSHEIKKIRGCRTAEITKRLGYKFSDEVIHRDNLVIVIPGS